MPLPAGVAMSNAIARIAGAVQEPVVRRGSRQLLTPAASCTQELTSRISCHLVKHPCKGVTCQNS